MHTIAVDTQIPVTPESARALVRHYEHHGFSCPRCGGSRVVTETEPVRNSYPCRACENGRVPVKKAVPSVYAAPACPSLSGLVDWLLAPTRRNRYQARYEAEKRAYEEALRAI